MNSELELSTATGVGLNLPLAGAGSRAYAYIIDWHIRIGGVLVWVIGWLVVESPIDPPTMLEDRASMLWLSSVPALFYVLYHPVVELLLRGDSPGKRIAGIHCVDAHGNLPGSGAILLRNVMRIVDSLPAFYTVGMFCILLTKEQLRLGDMVAGTRMIVASDDGGASLARLDKIQLASIAPEEAELVYDVLSRWRSLTKRRRGEIARALLSRLGVTAERNDKALKRQLEALLGS